MQFFHLRESLVHSDAGFPLHAYDLANQDRFVFPCHWHPEWEFILVTEGQLLLQKADQLVRIGTGEVALLGSAELHTGNSDGQTCRCRPVVFNPSLLDPAVPDNGTGSWLLPLSRRELILPARITPADNQGAQIIQLLSDIITAADQQQPGRELLIRGGLLQLVGLLAAGGHLQPGAIPATGHSAREDIRLRSVLSHIEHNLNQAITLDGLAGVACLSPSAFSRFFKAMTGETAMEYINRSRMVRAAALIQQSGWSVSVAAAAVGFDNLSYFTRTFRRFMGVLPSDLKAR